MTTRWKAVAAAVLMTVLSLSGVPALAGALEGPPAGTLAERFAYLSTHGNSNCSRQFMESIATMSPMMRLQGSCCSPMDLHRYGGQVEGLKAYADLPMIPADPYDIPAGLAAELMSSYDLDLTAVEQAAYDHAMANSNEGGPCCCRCWRWQVYGGLAKRLIRERGFTGDQIAGLWDLSDGCGGDSHVHGT